MPMSPDRSIRRKIYNSLTAAGLALLLSSGTTHAQEGEPNQPPVISSSTDNPSMLFIPAVSFEPTLPLEPIVEDQPVDIEAWKSELSGQMMPLGIRILQDQISMDLKDFTPAEQRRIHEAFSISFQQILQARSELHGAGSMTLDELDEITDKNIISLSIVSDPTIVGAGTTQTIYEGGGIKVKIRLGTAVPKETGIVMNELIHLLFNVKMLYENHPQTADYLSEMISTAANMWFLLNNVKADGTGLVSLDEMRRYLREVRTHSFLNWSEGKTISDQGEVIPDEWNSLTRLLSSMHMLRQEIFRNDWMFIRFSEAAASEIVAELLNEEGPRTNMMKWIFQYMFYQNKGEPAYDESKHGPIPRLLDKLGQQGRLPTLEQEADGPKRGASEVYAWDVARPWGSEEMIVNGRRVMGTSMLNMTTVLDENEIRIYPPTALGAAVSPDILIDPSKIATISYVGTGFMGLFFETGSVTDRSGVPIVPPDGTVFTLTSMVEGVQMVHKVVYSYMPGNPPAALQINGEGFSWEVNEDRKSLSQYHQPYVCYGDKSKPKVVIPLIAAENESESQ